ncbi:MAG: coniferyl aldehyde dehydrogenase [Verrucomicrobia bacterium]|nr:coniferyl aldehyde dehydrogenase [Verrucomicrobiota bacterium]
MNELRDLFDRQRAAFEREPFPDLRTRRDRVGRILALTLEHESDLVAAISRDFGHRCAQETRLAELFIVITAARTALRRLPRWMHPQRVATPVNLLPGRSELRPQPLGVVGIISPWNYPYQLAMLPALGALAAGNRVLLKPSELTPTFSALLRELVARRFSEEEFAVVLGDAAVGGAFAELPWDHLFFTGSTAVGRQVALAAAANLTPVTLELGGKSPALFAPDADFALTLPRLAAGKLLNAGQTCIAPDYALVPAARREAWVAGLKAAVAALYPTIAGNPDYTAIISERHFQRLTGLMEDARRRGATVVDLRPAGEAPDPARRRFPPTLLLNVTEEMAVMREEIFGPLLPVETYESLEEAIRRVNARPRPLALYFFGERAVDRERVLQETIAGGVTVNDTLWHIVNEKLPFGGVGPSGQGCYHGEHSFRRFSHLKPVFYQSRWATGKFLWPPYGARFDRIFGWIKRLSR